MRLKNINIDERSSTFSDESQKKSLKEMSSSINQLGEVFDNMVNFESFIVQNINEELSTLMGIRQDKDKLIEQHGPDIYLEDYFKPAVYKIEEKIAKNVSDWDGAEDRLHTDEIKNTITVIKEVSNVLKNIDNPKFKSMAILKDLIDEFGYFQICKAIFTGDIVERMNVFTSLKSEIEQVFSPPKANEPKEPEKRRKRLTIDDL